MLRGSPRSEVARERYWRPAQVRLPALAQIAGVRVGYDTIQYLEHCLGPGRKITGGHPHGGRIWEDRRSGLEIWADGFSSYAALKDQTYTGGRVIDRLSLSRSRNGTGNLFFMNRVRLGMTQAQVVRALTGILPPPIVQKDTWTWKASGLSGDKQTFEYQAWTAELTFKAGALDRITVQAD